METSLPVRQRLTAPAKWLSDVVEALNNEVTRLTGKKPAATVKENGAAAKPSTPYVRPVGVNQKKLPSNVNVCFLCASDELEGRKKRATDPNWSLIVYTLSMASSVTKPDEPVIYYLCNGPKRGFVLEDLFVVPPNTYLPPAYVV